jgi:hypothetical protein
MRDKERGRVGGMERNRTRRRDRERVRERIEREIGNGIRIEMCMRIGVDMEVGIG